MRGLFRCLAASWLAWTAGCGSTNSRKATEQMLMSDAVDRSVAQIDFDPLAGKKVYLDSTYFTHIKMVDLVNPDYITSSLRQHLFAAGCLVQDNRDEADYVVEARLGALATDGHDVIIGIPASNAVAAAASALPNAPPVPTIPEISLARRNAQTGASKIAAFAYNRTTKRIVWQSGISTAIGDAKDTWVFGAGPFQKGSIYDGTLFAGSRIAIFNHDEESHEAEIRASYDAEIVFPNELESIDEAHVHLSPPNDPPEKSGGEPDSKPAADEGSAKDSSTDELPNDTK